MWVCNVMIYGRAIRWYMGVQCNDMWVCNLMIKGCAMRWYMGVQCDNIWVCNVIICGYAIYWYMGVQCVNTLVDEKTIVINCCDVHTWTPQYPMGPRKRSHSAAMSLHFHSNRCVMVWRPGAQVGLLQVPPWTETPKPKLLHIWSDFGKIVSMF